MIDSSHKLWEVINPSDRVTFRTDSLMVATYVTILLGGGKYASREILPDGRHGLEVPLFLFGGVDQFCEENFGVPWEQTEARLIADCLPEVIAALRSLIYGDLGDRKLIEELLAALPDDEARTARLVEWNDERRSSMNNIGGRAFAIADRLEEIQRDATEEKKAVEG